MARRYSQDEIDIGLTALVVCDGNSRRAEKELEAMGARIPASTLSNWTKERREDLDRVAREMAPQLREKKAQALDDLAHAATEVTRKGLDLLDGKMADLAPRDLPGAIRNTATVVGISTEKAALLRQQPTSIVHHDHSSAMRFLERKGLVKKVEAEVEVIEA